MHSPPTKTRFYDIFLLSKLYEIYTVLDKLCRCEIIYNLWKYNRLYTNDQWKVLRVHKYIVFQVISFKFWHTLVVTSVRITFRNSVCCIWHFVCRGRSNVMFYMFGKALFVYPNCLPTHTLIWTTVSNLS